MLGFITKMFIGLSCACTTGSFGRSLASNSKGCTKCVSLKNQTYQIRPTLVNVNSNETVFLSFNWQR